MTGIFDQVLKVHPEHIDRLGHVNNVIYVQWMQDVASAHIEQLGLGLNEYLQLKHAMVAVEHHVQYRKAAFEGDELILRTWLSDLNALYSFRQYAFIVHRIRMSYLPVARSGPVSKLRRVVRSVCRQVLPKLISLSQTVLTLMIFLLYI